jgi:hypothetical protein
VGLPSSLTIAGTPGDDVYKTDQKQMSNLARHLLLQNALTAILYRRELLPTETPGA